ncbi:hypothetical protein A4X09_0g1255 [Tilletia walkeri]|uniref:Nitrogen regulatory protein areA GATA-like domain-containing protein n=1 Tax=Tilletia walkeri TaxID=117179 RepID=A0A8X7T783_9BASI|nr:hypothetical protein A4X09_0g1255 [Tilletia walkeri]
MLSAPAPYPTVSSSIPAPDDAQIVPSHRLPSICVDYLSHQWARDEDVWNSWKAMTKSKNEIANGVRLENASWRTWMKQMRNLKTVSPETLNWLKDSDVTWLYGPLHQGQIEAVPPPKIASTTERLDLIENSRPPPPKNANSTSAASLPRPKISDLRPDSSSGRKVANVADLSSSLPQRELNSHNRSGSSGKITSNGANSRRYPSPHRGSTMDPSLSPPATKSILKHRTIQDLLSNPQANSAAGVGSALGLRSASQPSLPELEAAAAATSLALREGQGEAVLSPDQARALGLLGVANSHNSSHSSDMSGSTPTAGKDGLGSITDHVLSSSPNGAKFTIGDGLVSPTPVDQQSVSSLSLASDGEADTPATSSLKSPTASAVSLASLASSTGSGTPNTARSSRVGLSGAAGKAAAAVKPERRHISFNQRVEQCIALDMDNAPEYLSYDDEEEDDGDDDGGAGGSSRGMHAGGYGYGDEDEGEDEEESIMWRSGPGQRVQRRPRFDDDDEEEMLTINVRSSSSLRGGGGSGTTGTGARPSSSSGGSSTSATSLSTRSHRSTHSISRRTIAKLAPTMLRGGSAQPETGEWIDHEESDAHDVDVHSGLGPGMIGAGVGMGENAHVPAYAHNPVVSVDRDHQAPTTRGGSSLASPSGASGGLDHTGAEGGADGDGLLDGEDDGGRGRAPEPTRTFAYGRVHQSGRYTGSGPNQQQPGDSYEYGGSSDGGDWENSRSLDLASPPFPGGEDEEEWEGDEDGERYLRGGVPADDVALRNRNKARQGGGSSSKQGSGGRARGDGPVGSSDFWADGDADGDEGGLHQGNSKSRRARNNQTDAPASPASSSSSFSSSSYKGKPSSSRSSGERRRQSSTDVSLEDQAVHGVLSIDVDNVPSNDPNSPVNPAHGPTPLNTPTFLLGGKPGKGASKSASANAAARSRRGGGGSSSGGSRSVPSSSSTPAGGHGRSTSATSASSATAAFDDEDDEDDYDPAMAVLPHRRTSTGALVAPKNRQVQVPLAHDYVDEGDEGGLINRAVEMINTARDLIGALWGASDSDRGRSWRDSTYE